MSNLLEKASILLTPTAYSDGSLNTVLPEYQVLPQELVTNGTFDTDSDWSATNSTISISNGVCQVNPTAIFGYLNSTSSFQTGVGKKYVFSFDCISRTGSGNVYLQIGTFQNGNNVTNQNIGNIEDNTSYSITFTATSTTSFLRIGFGGSGTSATIDNVSVKEIQEADFDFSRGSSATRVNEQGLIEDVASNIPRIDYTSGQGALLLEPQSTNVLENSEITSTWVYTEFGSGSAGTITTGKTDMFGGTNAVQVDFPADAENVSLTFGQTSSSISSGSATASVYIKLVESGSKTLQLRCSTGIVSNVLVDTTDFVRYEATGTKNFSESFNVKLRPSSGTSSGGFSIIICHPQEEAGNATSYIPTSGATVTRSADVANNSGNADLINSTEGVLYAEIAALADYGTYRMISLSDGTAVNRISIFYQNTSNQIAVESSGSGVNLGIYNQTLNVVDNNKIALKYKANDCALWINGFEVAIDTTFNAFANNTLLKLNFDRGDGGFDFYGNVKSVAVFKEALTDAELACLTS